MRDYDDFFVVCCAVNMLLQGPNYTGIVLQLFPNPGIEFRGLLSDRIEGGCCRSLSRLDPGALQDHPGIFATRKDGGA